nr:DEAD/DEAH box helicase [Cupriavidus oxalaticus]
MIAPAAIGALRPYQQGGVAFLVEHQGALLADEMGLGKTVQAIAAIAHLRFEVVLARTLIVTPTSLTSNWMQELARWAPALACRRIIGNAEDRRATYGLPIPVLLANYQQIRTDIQQVLADGLRWDLVVLDEAQWIKNRHSSTSLACKLLRRTRSWALSATPLENRLEEFASVLDYVLDRASAFSYTRNQLHEEAEGHFLRRRKAEVLQELPPMIIQELPVDLLPSQRATYDDLESEAINMASELNAPASILAEITRLKQVCNFDPETGESAKLEVLQGILQSLCNADDKVIVFSQYVETLERVASQIDLPADIYHGALASAERDEVLSHFRSEPGPRVLLVSLRAGGVGLNIPEASHVVLFDRWWNPAVEDQAIQRAHRFGRLSTLIVIKLVVVDSVEERITELLHQKRELFAAVIDDAPSSKIDSTILRHVLTGVSQANTQTERKVSSEQI